MLKCIKMYKMYEETGPLFCVTKTQDKKQAVEMIPKISKAFQLANKDLKTAIINMFKEVKKFS